jgi:hypothetical protein
MVISCFLSLFFISFSQAQTITIKPGATQIGLNQYFTLTLTVENDRLKKYSPFPDIEGFVKRGTSSSTSTSVVNGQMTSSQSISQNYQARQEGTFRLQNFEMTVNDKAVSTSGFTIKVGPALQQKRRRDPSGDPFQNFFNNEPAQATEFVDIKADAFLALTIDKTEVYIGEGFTTTLAFYVSESNKADMRFYDLGKQITDIVKNINPANCWEENFSIDNITGEPITINNKGYTQYKIFQAAYYPLNDEDIEFKSVGLKMIKYQVAKNPSFFGRNRKEDFETFYSKAKKVTVKELPPHPLKDRVAVGNYRMAEKINALDLKTGQSFNYEFNILGEGNISAIESLNIPSSEEFDIYDPNVKQNINRSNGKVKGTKTFNFYGIPNEPGQFQLGDYFNWIYFNPTKEKYDTLKSQHIVTVSGESRKNEYIISNDMGSFYDGIAFEDDTMINTTESAWFKTFVNVFILAMLALSVGILSKK